jgi:hypothetical protein
MLDPLGAIALRLAHPLNLEPSPTHSIMHRRLGPADNRWGIRITLLAGLALHHHETVKCLPAYVAWRR